MTKCRAISKRVRISSPLTHKVDELWALTLDGGTSVHVIGMDFQAVGTVIAARFFVARQFATTN